ncbi:MAG: serine/threonine protein kinase [Gemmatimonadaceae bacterium]|nr:serine/threonine protein kinase [Gemmatimonadaceae bacterium]
MSAPLVERLRSALAPRYRVERELGRGGMGTVLLAHDDVLDRPVAIKVIDPELAATAALRQRFLAEARTVAALRHPGIVQVFDAGETGGLLWFAMQYVPGESLRDRLLRVQRLAPGEAVPLLRDLALALHAAHAAGVVHRDVKPENVLIDEATGRAHVTDFGIARALSHSGDTGATGTGFVMGSPRYMSPEQAAGDRALDGRSDLYALGLVGYEMLVGASPFEATTPQALLAKQITEAPKPLATHRRDVPAHVSWAIERALAKNAAERWADGATMARALEGAEPMRRGVSRGADAGPSRRTLLTGIGAAALVAVIGWLALRRDARPAAATAAALPADGSRSFFVVPFDVQSGDPSLEWLHEGSVNMLSLTLAQWSDVRVTDYERALDLLRDAALDTATRIGLADAQQLGRRAGVRALIMGQLQTTRDSLIVIARSYDVSTGARLAQSQRSVTRAADPRALFDAIARDLLGLDGAPAGVVDVARATTSSIVAYQSYLHATRRANNWQLAAADSLLTTAIAADSTFALAWYRRSQVRTWSRVEQRSALSDAATAVRFADRLVPSQRAIVEANLILLRGNAAITEGRPDSARVLWAEARRAYAAIVQRDSTLAEAWYGLGVTSSPFFVVEPDSVDAAARAATRALRALQRSIALDSAYYFAYPSLVQLYQMGVDGGTFALVGDSIVANRGRQRPQSAEEREQLGRAARARVGDALRRWLEAAPDASIAYRQLALNYLITEFPDSAALVLERAMARPAARSPTMPFELAVARMRMDDPGALAVLRTAVSSTTPASLRSGTSDERFFIVGQTMGVAAAFGQPRDVDALTRLVLATDSLMPYTQLALAPTMQWYGAIMRLAMGSAYTGRLRAALDNGLAFVDTTTLPLGTVIRAQSSNVPYLLALTTRDTSYVRQMRRWLGDRVVPFPELEALALLARGDTIAARRAATRIPPLDSLRNYPLSFSGLRMIGRAEVFAQLGETRRALAIYELLEPKRFLASGGFGDPGYVLYVRSLLTRARLYEQLGERARALTEYERFLGWWRGADAAYDAERREAIAAVARLRDRS